MFYFFFLCTKKKTMSRDILQLMLCYVWNVPIELRVIICNYAWDYLCDEKIQNAVNECNCLHTILLYGHIEYWDTSRVTNMDNLFSGLATFNSDISRWNTSNVTSMKAVFASANSFNQQIGNWDVSSVESMAEMFDKAFAFNQPLDQFVCADRFVYMHEILDGATSFSYSPPSRIGKQTKV